jgi:hypothetical protein
MAPTGINRPGYSSSPTGINRPGYSSPKPPTGVNRPGRNDNDRGPNIVMKSKPSIPSPAYLIVIRDNLVVLVLFPLKVVFNTINSKIPMEQLTSDNNILTIDLFLPSDYNEEECKINY